MNAITFDTLAFSRMLENAGMPKEHADAITEAQRQAASEIVSANQLVTKSDLLETRNDLKEDIQTVRSELKEEIQAVRSELKEEIQTVRSELKEEIQTVRSELKEEIQEVRSELKEEILEVRIELQAQIGASKHEILKWMITAMLAQTGLLLAVLKFFK